MTYWTIKLLSWVGLAKDIVLPPEPDLPGQTREPSQPQRWHDSWSQLRRGLTNPNAD